MALFTDGGGLFDELLGGGSGGVYDLSSPTTVQFGAINPGTNITGLTWQQIIEAAAAPDVAPVFSSFNITQSPSPLEVGTTISGLKAFSWAFSLPAKVLANSLSVLDVTAGNVPIVTNQSTASPQSFNIGTITPTSPVTRQWRATAKKLDGTTFQSGLASIPFYWRKYWGNSPNATLTESEILDLVSSELDADKNGTFDFEAAANNYKYMVWVDSLGSPTAVTGVKDASTNFPIPQADSTDNPAYSFTQNGWSYDKKTITNAQGVSVVVRIYRSKEKLGGAINAIVS